MNRCSTTNINEINETTKPSLLSLLGFGLCWFVLVLLTKLAGLPHANHQLLTDSGRKFINLAVAFGIEAELIGKLCYHISQCMIGSVTMVDKVSFSKTGVLRR